MTFDIFYNKVMGNDVNLMRLFPKNRLEKMIDTVEVFVQEAGNQSVVKLKHTHIPSILRPTPLSVAKLLLKPITALDFNHVWQEARKQVHFKLEDTPEIFTKETKDGGMYATLTVQKDSLLFILEVKLRANSPDHRVEMVFKVIEDSEVMIELFRKEVNYDLPIEYDATGLALYGFAIYQ